MVAVNGRGAYNKSQGHRHRLRTKAHYCKNADHLLGFPASSTAAQLMTIPPRHVG